MTTREEIQEAARKLGAMLAECGDFYDVTEPFAEGYAAAKEGEALTGQLVALNALRMAASTVTEWRVEDARKARMSWQAIGDALDISRQAAHERFKEAV